MMDIPDEPISNPFESESDFDFDVDSIPNPSENRSDFDFNIYSMKDGHSLLKLLEMPSAFDSTYTDYSPPPVHSVVVLKVTR